MKCPYCGNKDLIKYGYRKNKYYKTRKFKCRNCSRTFTPRDFSFGRKYSEEGIIGALELYYKVKSANKASKELKIPRQTILNWNKIFIIDNGNLEDKKKHYEGLKFLQEIKNIRLPKM